MAKDFKLVHAFQLNAADAAGGPGIFVWSVLPESIVELKANTTGGSSITIRMPNQEIVPLDVTQPPDVVREMKHRCEELDRRVSSSEV